MSMYNRLEKFQLPFDKTNLMDSRKFISFCRARGISLSEKRLEEYERTGLLFPVLRVFHPVGRYKRSPKDLSLVIPIADTERSSGKVFYRAEPILKHDGWMQSIQDPQKPKQWFENYEFELPIQNPFREWSKYKLSGLSIVENKKMLGTPAISYYSCLQLFLLLAIKQSERFPLDNANKDSAGLSRAMSDTLLVNDFHILASELHKEITLRVNRQEKNYAISRADYRAISERATQERAKKVQLILSTHEVTASTLREMAESFIAHGLSYDPAGQIRTLINQYVPEELLRDVRGTMLLAQDYYDVSDLLLTFLKVVVPSTKNSSLIISELQSRSPSCVICGSSFVSTKKGGKPQVTCANKACRRKRNTDSVSVRRKAGIYLKRKPILNKMAE